jgi:Serine/Threonine/Tyrosine Kinase found in polyvalent proteins
VSSSQDARRFHLWEATPIEYLQRLHLQNQLIPGLNSLEGVFVQPGDDMAIVTSQPRFDIVPVTTSEIDTWFTSLGFTKITSAAYYRPDDNLGIFDAHDKNLVRAGDVLIPFDVIPCHTAGGFLDFIAETITAGHSLHAVRTVTTAD